MKNTLQVARMLAGRKLRRTALVLGICAAALGSLAATTPAHASPAEFIGVWNNANPASSDLVRFIVGAVPGGLNVRVYGACSPTPCDWGLAPFTTYGNNVSDTDHKYGTAYYDQGFAQRTMTFQLIDPYTMVVDTYSRFSDGSGRQNYHMRDIFRKLQIVIDPLPFPRP